MATADLKDRRARVNALGSGNIEMAIGGHAGLSTKGGRQISELRSMCVMANGGAIDKVYITKPCMRIAVLYLASDASAFVGGQN